MLFTLSVIIFSLAYCLISLKIIKIRRREKILIGHQNSQILTRYIAAQKNFFEYSIIFILQVFILEVFVAHRIILTALLLLFIIARIMHFLSLVKIEMKDSENSKPKLLFRIWGARLTIFIILFCSFYLAFFII